MNFGEIIVQPVTLTEGPLPLLFADNVGMGTMYIHCSDSNVSPVLLPFSMEEGSLVLLRIIPMPSPTLSKAGLNHIMVLVSTERGR